MNDIKIVEQMSSWIKVNFVEPVLIKAGDQQLRLKGSPPSQDCRVISEDNYQLLKSIFDLWLRGGRIE